MPLLLFELLFSEVARWKKEGFVEEDFAIKLLALAKEPWVNSTPTYYFHYSDLNKLGINPRSGYQTPFGIYAYPLTEAIIPKIQNGTLPFAVERSWIHIFKARNPNNILNFSTYSSDKFYPDLIKMNAADEAENISAWAKNAIDYANDKSYGGMLWNITRIYSDKKPKTWRSTLVWLGYEGAYDRGESIIHENEPEQAVFFSKEYIEEQFSIMNPHGVVDAKTGNKSYRQSDNIKSAIVNEYKKALNGEIDLGIFYKLINSIFLKTIKDYKQNLLDALTKLGPKVFAKRSILTSISENLNFRNLDLTTTYFAASDLYGLSFQNCKLGPDTDLLDVKDFAKVTFIDSEISSRFEKQTFIRCNFTKCKLDGSRFYDCNFWSVSFSDCDLSQVVFKNCQAKDSIVPGWNVNPDTNILEKL